MNPKLIVVSGPPASGKRVIMRSVIEHEIVACTTRPKRPSEVDGKNYCYLSVDCFTNLRDRGKILEFSREDDAENYYGIIKEDVQKKIKKDLCFCIADFAIMKHIKSIYDNVFTLFIYSDKEDIKRNMRDRGDSKESINKQISLYEKQIENLYQYDEVVTNHYGYLELAIEDVKDIVGIAKVKE